MSRTEDVPTGSPTGRERDTLPSAIADGHEEQPGDQVGPFKLISIVGEGAFGIVWIAERREPFVQRCAVKIIKPGMDSKAVLARFQRERQILATLGDHAAIAKILDGGMTSRGRPYFAMELVQGSPITEYCDQRRWTISERLHLFAAMCDAMEFAHRHGVVHRDIKPSNVLVHAPLGLAGVKVIDFGVAKALTYGAGDQTVWSQRGVPIGTLEYMSPEQATLGGTDADARSDVYSMGVVLYELITSRLPFESEVLRKAKFTEACRIISEVDPPHLTASLQAAGGMLEAIGRNRQITRSALVELVRRDLQDIVMACLEKDPRNRYQSAAELRDDVLRFLSNMPLQALPRRSRSATYMLGKWLDRREVLTHLSMFVSSVYIVVFCVCAVACVLVLLDWAYALKLFGTYGPGGLSVAGAIGMNVAGAALTGSGLWLSKHISKLRMGPTIACAVLSCMAAAWPIAVLLGVLPYEAGGLLTDSRFRRTFSLVYVVIFSMQAFAAVVCVPVSVLVRKFGRVREVTP